MAGEEPPVGVPQRDCVARRYVEIEDSWVRVREPVTCLQVSLSHVCRRPVRRDVVEVEDEVRLDDIRATRAENARWISQGRDQVDGPCTGEEQVASQRSGRERQ